MNISKSFQSFLLVAGIMTGIVMIVAVLLSVFYNVYSPIIYRILEQHGHTGIYTVPMLKTLWFAVIVVFGVLLISEYFLLEKGVNVIDFLKIVAALCVFVLHVSIFTNQISDNSTIFANGYMKNFSTPAWGGVWIFFFVSGFTLATGFPIKYGYTSDKLKEYYLRRMQKIWLPTVVFNLVLCLFSYPDFIPNNPAVLLEWLVCSFNGNPGVDGVGATWFVFTIMWLYVFFPLMNFIADKVSKCGNKTVVFLLVLTVLMGLAFRMTGKIMGWDWYSFVYTPPYANFDLFFCGVLVKHIKARRKSCNSVKIASVALLILFISFNSWTYDLWFYPYLYPSIYIFILSLVVYTWNILDGTECIVCCRGGG